MRRANRPTGALSISDGRTAEYLVEYIRRYRKEYARFTAPAPNGADYPRLDISPYLNASQITCLVARDGYIVTDLSGEPKDPNFATWIEIVPGSLAPDVRSGLLPTVAKAPVKRRVDDGTTVIVETYKVSLSTLLARLTLGFLGRAVEIPLPGVSDAFWKPMLLRSIGFRSAGAEHKRWLSYLEAHRHTDRAAWDQRSIWARVNVDVRRDFVHCVGMIDKSGGTIDVTGHGRDAEAHLDLNRRTADRLNTLSGAIDGLAALLREHGDDSEETFQRYLAEHPILLTLYGVPESKPRLRYPAGILSPTGKTYVEPDFIIRYPADGRYELVELERPDMEFLTKRGEPRSAVAHANFQIAEWMHYIHNHYDLIRGRFPGISSEPLKRVIISRSVEDQLSGRGLQEYLALLREMNRDYKIITYDVLLEEARIAYARLAGAMTADYDTVPSAKVSSLPNLRPHR